MGTLIRLESHLVSVLECQRLNSFVPIPHFSTVVIMNEQAGSLGFGDAIGGGALVVSFLLNF